MSVLAVIPARHASTRFPGKPLAPIAGPDGVKTLIRRSWEAARAIPADRLVIATDDARVADHARAFGAEVVMTSPDCRNGSERCAEVARHFPDHEIVVNFQGDGPLMPGAFAAPLIAALARDPGLAMATPVLAASPAVRALLLADQAAGKAGGTTAVLRPGGEALYFSKSVLPRSDDPSVPLYHHLGLYAFRRAALLDYASWPPGRLELAEGLEQLRFLEAGRTVLCLTLDPPGHEIWEVNLPEDVARVEAILAARPRP